MILLNLLAILGVISNGSFRFFIEFDTIVGYKTFNIVFQSLSSEIIFTR